MIINFLSGALMEKIQSESHGVICNVEEPCKMEVFGRSHIPGFKSEAGYGYYEFTQEEFLKTCINVILMDKVYYSVIMNRNLTIKLE